MRCEQCNKKVFEKLNLKVCVECGAYVCEECYGEDDLCECCLIEDREAGEEEE